MGNGITPTTDAPTLSSQLESGTDFASKEFWDDLLAYIDSGEVIPVIGPELLTIERDGKLVSLYRIVAEQLLTRYGLNSSPDETELDDNGVQENDLVILRHGYELNDAVCALSERKNRRLQDLYRPIHDILLEVQKKHRDELIKPLLKLAKINKFKYFITTTCDTLLAEALNETRYQGQPRADEIEYAPNLSGDRKRDLPKIQPGDYSLVFYIFGKASASPMYAIHEEDILEFVYELQEGIGAGPEQLMGLVRSRNMMFIGCPLTDWLGRILVRMSSQDRLFSSRSTREFMAINQSYSDPGLIQFLVSFSHDTHIHFDEAGHFVDKLFQYWQERNPVLTSEQTAQSSAQKELSGKIFISYAREDYSAANRLYENLKEIAGGDDIAWLDKQGGLNWGDDWEISIKRGINSSMLFIPLISSNTEQRDEGVFRKEWGWACDRDQGIQGRRYILPLIIDETTANSSVDDLLVHECIRAKQFKMAIGGELNEELRKLLVDEVRNMRRGSNR